MTTDENKMKLKERVYEFLKRHYDEGNRNARFTGLKIAEQYAKEYPDAVIQKQKKSTATKYPLATTDEAIKQIAREISSRASRGDFEDIPQIIITGGYPRKYYYTESSEDDLADQQEVAEEVKVAIEPEAGQSSLSEKDLYPMLSDYLFSMKPQIYSKRIDESVSKNDRGSGGNKWLYPDIVGVDLLNKDWGTKVMECVGLHGDTTIRFWSFEVKLKIERNKLRDYFLQAVTNSSWANFGYLVAREITDNAMGELHILANLHGIGFIKLDEENPLESQILIPAKERAQVDWNTVNRLTEQNTDFEKYIDHIIDFYKTGRIRDDEWDGQVVVSDE